MSIVWVYSTITGVGGQGDTAAFGGSVGDDRLVMMIAKEGRGLTLPVKGLIGHVTANGEVVNVANAYRDSRFDPTMDVKTNYKTRSVLCAPVFASVESYAALGTSQKGGGKKKKKQSGQQQPHDVIAVIELINKMDGGTFTDEDEHNIARICEQLTHTLHQKQLELAVHSSRDVRPNRRVIEPLRVCIRSLSMDLPKSKVTKRTGTRLRAGSSGRRSGKDAFEIRESIKISCSLILGGTALTRRPMVTPDATTVAIKSSAIMKRYRSSTISQADALMQAAEDNNSNTKGNNGTTGGGGDAEGGDMNVNNNNGGGKQYNIMTVWHTGGLTAGADGTVLEADMLVRDVPRAARLHLTVTSDDEPIAWGQCPVYDFNQSMQDGVLSIPLSYGKCADVALTGFSTSKVFTAGANHEEEMRIEEVGSCGSIHLYFELPEHVGTEKAPIVFTDYDEDASQGRGHHHHSGDGRLEGRPSDPRMADSPFRQSADLSLESSTSNSSSSTAMVGSTGGETRNALASAARRLTTQGKGILLFRAAAFSHAKKKVGGGGSSSSGGISSLLTATKVIRDDKWLKTPDGIRAQKITSSDPLHVLTDDDRSFVWSARHELVRRPHLKALPKFLLSVPWANRAGVLEAYRLLYIFESPGPYEALQLLDARFPDPKVRAFAVQCLDALSDEELGRYVLQLTQVLKHEPWHDSALARFLLRRALRSPYVVGHRLFWGLKAEMHIPTAKERYGVLLEIYLRHCGTHRVALGHQIFIMEKLGQAAAKIVSMEGDKASRHRAMEAELSDIVFPEKIQLPLSAGVWLRGLNIDECRVMSSKKRPLWLSFERVPEEKQQQDGGGGSEGQAAGGGRIQVLFKYGDDLRQDQLTLQILRIMDSLWKEVGLDLLLNAYECVTTGDEIGLIEVVQNSETLASIVAKSALQKRGSLGKMGSLRKIAAARDAYFDSNVVLRWLIRHNHRVTIQHCMSGVSDASSSSYNVGDSSDGGDGDGIRARVSRGNFDQLKAESPRAALRVNKAAKGNSRKHRAARKKLVEEDENIQRAVDAFCRSCAGYCVATYVLGVGDRHSSNIMLQRDGKMFHIDFGHFLGNYKTKYGYRRETAPFVFTPQFLQALGGKKGPAFLKFVDLSCKAYNTLRENANLIITLFSLMLSCGIPELRCPGDISWIRDHLLLGGTKEEGAKHFKKMIFKSLANRRLRINQAVHLIKHA